MNSKPSLYASFNQTGLQSEEQECHLESDQTVENECCGDDAGTLSSGSSELQDLSSRDKILPNKGNFFTNQCNT